MASEADMRLGCMQAIQKVLDALPTEELRLVQRYLDSKLARLKSGPLAGSIFSYPPKAED